MRGMLLVVVFAAFGLVGRATASVIDFDSYYSDADNPVYWSAFDLDIMRLSWADTLGLPKQAELSDIDLFVANTTAGWRWATLTEFALLHQFFDTDADADGWSQAQNAGSSLFFSLNGVGQAFAAQAGYDFEGYTYWQFGTQVDGGMHYVWMADFATNLPGISCAEYSMLCGSGYFTDANSPLWLASNVLNMADINVAPLLVRDKVPTPDSAVVVPAPASLWLMTLAVISLLGRRRALK